MLDVLGRTTIEGTVPASGSLTLDVSALPNGVYYVCEGQNEICFVKN